jgi:hypothetical protein
MGTLIFKGRITTNSRQYAKLLFPDSNELSGAPDDWPGRNLYRGSLNVTINDDGFPTKWDRFGKLPKVKRLDSKLFAPEFVIPGRTIENNILTPQRTGLPDGGDAQVWRANLRVDETSEEVDCWLVRRIGSGVGNYLELVSESFLRSKLNLEDGTRVTVTVTGVLVRN